MVTYKAPLLDRTDANEVRKFNELVDKTHSASFPESARKPELPKQEFDAKVARLKDITSNFKLPGQIQNYKKKA